MEQIIFRETTTIGIRRQEMERTILKREKRTVTTPLGNVEVKAVSYTHLDVYKRQVYLYLVRDDCDLQFYHWKTADLSGHRKP